MNRKSTAIRNIVNVLCYDPMAQIVKAEYYKHPLATPNKVEIEAITMLESISLLEDNVVFSDLVDWTYENVSDVSETEDFVLYGNLRDLIDETVVIVYLRLVDDHIVEHVETELNKKYLFDIKSIAN